MDHPVERIAALPDPEFAAFVERLGGVWPEWEAAASPVSPDGTVELSLSREREGREPERAVVRVCRGGTTVEDVNDFAVFAAERGLEFAVLATVGEASSDAVARARAAPVELYDGVGLVGLARDAGVAIPDAPGGRADDAGGPDGPGALDLPDTIDDDADPGSESESESEPESESESGSDSDADP